MNFRLPVTAWLLAAVLLARAKLAVERADAAWLIRRATPGAPSDGANYEDFLRAAGEARSTAEEAFRALPGSDDARRVLVNALRIFGEVDRGREIASGLHDKTSPESVYAQATLDLLTPGVAPEGPAERLRQNAWVDGIPGKGRATLVYALVRAGDADGASRELDLLYHRPAQQSVKRIGDTLVTVSTPRPSLWAGVAVSGTFTAEGVASSFEATVPWQIRQGDAVVKEGF